MNKTPWKLEGSRFAGVKSKDFGSGLLGLPEGLKLLGLWEVTGSGA